MKNELNGLPFMQEADINYGADDAGYYADHPAPVLFNVFQARKDSQAVLQIAALGLYTCSINGKPISDTVLNGQWTNYTRTVYYDTFDVSALLEEGENTIEITLGNGFYNPSPLRLFGKYNLRQTLAEVGTPKVCVCLQVDGQKELVSDESWQIRYSNLLFNNIYLGERADFTFADPAIRPVVLKPLEKNLAEAAMESIVRHQRVKPVRIEADGEDLLADFGEMITGFIDISWQGQAGQQVICRFAERRRADGSLDFLSNANGSVGEVRPDGLKIDGGPGAPEFAYEEDVLISRKGKNHFENTFSYHSFRYCLIKGLKREDLLELEGIYVHTNVKRTGYVKTSDSFLNALYEAAVRTKLNNLHFSFEDCARERLGYGGDMVSLADSNLYTFDLKRVYEKILIDFRNDQTPAGGMPETAPYMGIQSQGTAPGEGPLLWQYVFPYLLWKLLQFYDDRAFAEKMYPALVKQMEYLCRWDPEKLATHCLGDHGSVLIMGQFYKPTPDKELVGWCTQVLFLDTFLRISRILDKDEAGLQCYEQRKEALKREIRHRFRQEDGRYGEGTQTGLAFAAMAELEDPAALAKQLAALIEKEQGIFNAGIFGAKFTYDLLHGIGRDDLSEYWLSQDSPVSFRQMLGSGAKAMAELFAGESYSDNHAMFTSFLQWYYQALAGLSIEEEAVGFNRMVLQPYFSARLDFVEAGIETIHGPVHSSWKRQSDGTIDWQVRLPEAIEARFPFLPDTVRLSLTRII